MGRPSYEDLIIDHIHLPEVPHTQLLLVVIPIIFGINAECLALSKEQVNFLIGLIVKCSVREVQVVTVHKNLDGGTYDLLEGNAVDEMPKSERCVVEKPNEDFIFVDEAGVD